MHMNRNVYVLVLYRQFSDLSTHSLENIFVLPESSVPQIGSKVMLQLVSQPFVFSRWPLVVWKTNSSARTAIETHTQSIERHQ